MREMQKGCKYERAGDCLRLTGYEGTEEIVRISAFPEQQCSTLPVARIGDKAFLSCKSIEEMEIPATVTEIGNWAFAHMTNLCKLKVTGADKGWEPSVGKDIFLGCGRLDFFTVNGFPQEMGYMALRACMWMGKKEFLSFWPGREKQWFTNWDKAYVSYLEQDDNTGFRGMWAGGEEDYDGEDNRPEVYAAQSRMRKVELTYFRLAYPVYLEEGIRKQMLAYLQEHCLGREEEEAFTFLLSEKGRNRKYAELYGMAGGIKEDTMDRSFALMEENVELRAFFIEEYEKIRKEKEVWQIWEI